MTQIALTVADKGYPIMQSLQGEPRPRILVAFPYWSTYEVLHDQIQIRDFLLDSGAYTAYNTGRPVQVDDYIAFVQAVLARDGARCVGVFALDDIGSWEGTLNNLARMEAAGLQVIPTFHYGEPWEALEAFAAYPRIALGGLVAGSNRYHRKHAIPRVDRLRWLEQCFARLWPRWIHGFGVKDVGILRALPFASVDTANWFTDPFLWGKWKAIPWVRGRAPKRRDIVSLRGEVLWWLRLEAELQSRWSSALAGLEAVAV